MWRDVTTSSIGILYKMNLQCNNGGRMSLIDRTLDCSVGGRGVDSRGQINTQGLSEK